MNLVMNNVKKILKYILLFVFIYFFSKLLIYLGFNATYKNINVEGNLPKEIQVEYAQATKVNGRILGKVINDKDNDIQGKYIKVDIYNNRNELVGTKYIEINKIDINETKKFAVFFKKNSVKYCEISIVDKKDESKEKLFDDVFLKEDLKTRAIISTLIYALFLA